MIILIGPSASGKTEIAKALARDYGIKKATTHTTRPMRDGEKQDIDYHFVDEAAFAEMEKKGQFVETTTYNGNHYGSSKAEIALDKCIVVDPNGLKAFLSLKEKTVVSFFLLCPKAIRRKRMESRGDKPESIARRLEGDDATFDPTKIEKCDYYIDSSEKEVSQLTSEIVQLYRAHLEKN